jgi:hypothetical protein
MGWKWVSFFKLTHFPASDSWSLSPGYLEEASSAN